MTYAHIAKGGSLRFTQWYDFMDLTNYILGGGGAASNGSTQGQSDCSRDRALYAICRWSRSRLSNQDPRTRAPPNNMCETELEVHRMPVDPDSPRCSCWTNSWPVLCTWQTHEKSQSFTSKLLGCSESGSWGKSILLGIWNSTTGAFLISFVISPSRSCNAYISLATFDPHGPILN